MVACCKPILRLLAALALALGLTSAAHAEMPLQTCIAKLDAGASEAEQLLLPESRFDCQARQTDFGPGNFAVRFKFDPVGIDPANPLVLRFASVWQDSARIVFRYADGTTQELEYTSGQAARYLKAGAVFELPVPIHDAPLIAMQLETRGSANLRGIMLGAALTTHAEADDHTQWLIALYAAFGGLSLALIAYNLSLYVVLRHRFQLYYCALVCALGAYGFTSSGLVMRAIPTLGNNDRLRLNYLILAFAAVFAVRFIHAFFRRSESDRRMDRYIRVSAAALVVATLAFSILAPWQIVLLDRIAYIALAFLLAAIVPILLDAWRRGNRYLPMFMLSWTPPLVSTLLRLAHGFHLIPYSFWLDNGNLIALAIEALLSSTMIVMRLREMNKDRDKARANEQLALRLASSDSLTGLLNRRAFLDMAIGCQGQFRLLLIDLDHFKAINDRAGHDIGDEVLRKMALLLQEMRPRGSLVVRLGGEEFAMLVPIEREAECRPAQILERVRQLDLPLGLRITTSIGIAEGPITTEQDWKRLYRLADAALYRAKADGRDRACRATDFTSNTAPVAA